MSPQSTTALIELSWIPFVLLQFNKYLLALNIYKYIIYNIQKE